MIWESQMLGILSLQAHSFHPWWPGNRSKDCVLADLLTNFTDLISAILKTFSITKLVHYGFMLTMLLFIALIIVDLKCYLSDSSLHTLLHIMLGLFAFGLPGFEKAHAHEFCSLCCFVFFIKIKAMEKSHLSQRQLHRKISVCHQPQQCVWRPGYGGAA